MSGEKALLFSNEQKSYLKKGSFTTKNNIFLAPMAGITDMPFRRLCARFGAGLTYTEMVSAKGIYYNDKKTGRLTITHPDEAPCAVQIFGSEPNIMAEAVQVFNERDDIALIDINMGCPTPKIVKNGEGCALMQNEKLASEIIKAVVKASKKPVTVKFRKGFDRINAVEFARMAEGSGAAAVAVHGRTREQLYSGKADWDIIARVKQSVSIPVIGNGDVRTPEDAVKMFEQTGCDAVMVGRGALGNPWIFKKILQYIYNGELAPNPDNAEKYRIIKEHYEMMIEIKGEKTAVNEMRKHIAWYIKGMPGASNMRAEIMRVSLVGDALEMLEKYFKILPKLSYL
ncbi:MAG TPA: tRNA dihydrouridine synthase DusB [Clostridia bacterium]